MEYSPEEIDQLVKTLKELGVKLKADSKEDLVQWMSGYVAQAGVDEAQGGNEVKPQVQQASVVQNTVVKENIPRIPIFNGAAQTKAEHVPFEVWQYEVNCLMGSKRYSEAVILQAMRQSLRGDASKVAVRLGENVTVAQLLERMRNLYGSVSVGQDVLAAFYSAEQDQDENVVAWSCRLEDLMQQAIVENKFDVADRNEALRAKLWSGLRQELREKSGYKYDAINDYDKLLVELRKIEKDFIAKTGTVKKARVHSAQTDDEDLRSIVKQLQTKVSEFEKQNKTKASHEITCWQCGQVGHVKSGCRNRGHLNRSRSLGRGNQQTGAAQPRK